PRQLQAYEHRQDAADQHEGQSGEDEAQTYRAVVDRGQLPQQAGGVGPGAVHAGQRRRIVHAGRAHCVGPTIAVGSPPSCNHCSNLDGGRTTTSKLMWVCSRPQNSAHCPRMGLVESARRRMWLVRPGMASILPPSRGIQKLWMTSALVTWNSTVSPRGSTSRSRVLIRAVPSSSR